MENGRGGMQGQMVRGRERESKRYCLERKERDEGIDGWREREAECLRGRRGVCRDDRRKREAVLEEK